MMILRLVSFLFLLLFTLEALALSAVGWSFFESVNSSLSLLKYTSDNKARDILATVARVAESKMTPEGQAEMNHFFGKLIKQSEKDLDKFLIKEIYLVSNDGSLLSHSNPDELKNADLSRFNKPQHMRALRMRKGQLPTPQVIGEDYTGDDTMIGEFIMKHFPDIKYNTILLSSPVYHTEKLEAIASIHLVYNRGNVLFFIDNQRELLTWMLVNYGFIALALSFAIWVVFAVYTFGSFRQGAKVASNISRTSSPQKSKSKISAILDKQEETLHKYLTPIPARLDSNISLNIEDELDTEKSEAIHFDPIEETKPSMNGKTSINKTQKTEKPVQNPTEAIDAIYLD